MTTNNSQQIVSSYYNDAYCEKNEDGIYDVWSQDSTDTWEVIGFGATNEQAWDNAAKRVTDRYGA
jgi:hypothetical protein